MQAELSKLDREVAPILESVDVIVSVVFGELRKLWSELLVDKSIEEG